MIDHTHTQTLSRTHARTHARTHTLTLKQVVRTLSEQALDVEGDEKLGAEWVSVQV